MFKKFAFFILLVNFLSASNAQEIDLNTLKMADGFSINIYAHVKNPRQMTLGENGTVYVGTRSGAQGSVFALLNPDGSDMATDVLTVDKGLRSPNGVTFKDGDLYVAAMTTIFKYKNVAKNLGKNNDIEIITDQLPDEAMHSQRYLEFGPDGLLYVPIGSPCNNCMPKEDLFAALHTIDLNSKDQKLTSFAKGIRNTVGYDWNPLTNELWFTDNGVNGMEDDLPADELNYAPKKDMHFGFPFVHQGDTPDQKHGLGKNISDYTPPVQNLAPHSAALGMMFYTGDMLPPEFKNSIIIAEHGSWNRSEEAGHTGYRVTWVKLEGNKAVSYQPLVSGWLKNNQAWGRPTDVLQLPDGSILISDDFANVIYRLSFEK